MRVVEDTTPVERKTLVELSDKEIALIHRGLTLDNPDSVEQPTLYSEQYDIFSAFDSLMSDLGIAGVEDE